MIFFGLFYKNSIYDTLKQINIDEIFLLERP
jgi:hypothetical protein